MPVNHFDKASRYAAKLDPEAFLDWLMPGWRETVLFDGWLETRTIPFAEKNLAEESAGEALANVASGKWGRCLLPWIPLMQQGADAVIIEQWKLLAQQESVSKHRADYAGLALVFSELTNCHDVWAQALEGWNMEQSMQVLKWQAEAERRGKLEGKLEAETEGILRVLGRRFPHEVVVQLAEQIKSIRDMDTLDRLFDAALTVASLDEFRQNLVS